jgi:hypothetical protein
MLPTDYLRQGKIGYIYIINIMVGYIYIINIMNS